MHESLPYPYCTHAMLCTMHVIFGIHIALSLHPYQSRAEALNTDCSRFYAKCTAVTKAHAACPRPKSFVRRCTSETILTSADAACRRPVSFLRMMHHCASLHHGNMIVSSGSGPMQYCFVIHGLPMEALLEVRRAPYQD